MPKAIRVMPNPVEGWDVKEDESSDALVHFQDQADAIEYGRQHSRATGADLIVHRRILHLASHNRRPQPSASSQQAR